MPRFKPFVGFVGLALQMACSGPPAVDRSLASDTSVVVRPTLVQGSLPNDPDQPFTASVGFRQVLGDDEVRGLLRQYSVRPYEVYLDIGMGSHEVPAESASIAQIAVARRKALESPYYVSGVCMPQAELRAMRQHDPHVRPARGERNTIGRITLSRIELARRIRPRLERGEPVIYGLKVVGRSADLQRLAPDPRVRVFAPAERVNNGGREEWFVPGPPPPNEGQILPPPVPEIDALSEAEVQARLDRLARETLPECREWHRNHSEVGPIVRVPSHGRATFLNELSFRAETRLVSEAPAGVQAPVSIRTVVTVTNTSKQRVHTGIRGCTVLLRAYRTLARSGAPVWDQAQAVGCMQDPMRLSLAPGESREFETGADAWHVLSDSTPPGRYYFSALFRLADQTLELPAGDVELTPRQEGLAYRATSRLAWGWPAELETRATITNTTRRPVHIEYGACSLQIRAYRTPERSGSPVWYSERRQPADGSGSYGCPAYLAMHTIAPGESFSPPEFKERIPVKEILADSLPNGRYYFTGRLELNSRSTAEFKIGEAALTMRRPSLPKTRTADAVTYHARTELASASPLTVRTRVSATLTHAGGALLRYSADCPVTLLAYRDRARRDAAPRSGEPDWKSPRRCGKGLQEMSLDRGESRTFEVRATAGEILGSSLLPGKYYFAVAIQTDQQRVFLSAGETNLTR